MFRISCPKRCVFIKRKKKEEKRNKEKRAKSKPRVKSPNGEAGPSFVSLSYRKKRTGTACFSLVQEQPTWERLEHLLAPRGESSLLRDSPDHSATPSGESSSISFLLCIVTTIAWNFSPLSGRKYVSLAVDKKLPSSGKETWYHAGLTRKKGRCDGAGLERGRKGGRTECRVRFPSAAS